MKTLKLIALVVLASFFCCCKAATDTSGGGKKSLLEVQQILDSTRAKFYQFADSTGGDPWKSIMLTTDWVRSKPTVASAESIDSVYIYIFLKSGAKSIFSFNLVDSDGYSLFHGGGGSSPLKEPELTSSSTLSKNIIANKKVLIYVPQAAQFFKAGRLERIVGYCNTSTLGLDVTVLKDKECSYSMVEHFKDFGLTIIDGHGFPDGFATGIELPYEKWESDEALKTSITGNASLGEDGYNKLLSDLLRFVTTEQIDIKKPLWQRFDRSRVAELHVQLTSNYINTLPSMPGTVIFSGTCFGGQTTAVPGGTTPIQTAWTNKGPISYYSFAYKDGNSAMVYSPFCEDMIDTVVSSLVINGDSTGKAYKQADNKTEYYDPGAFKWYPAQKLFLRHAGADDYSYNDCVSEFTDDRDGQKYKAVCIGKQTWMAQNLNYNAGTGSACYGNNDANCSKYGRLYTWSTLMQGATSNNSDPSGVRGVCPKGWHVPSKAEWDRLLSSLGGLDVAGNALTSKLWGHGTTATNSTGFSVLAGGWWVQPPNIFSGLTTSASFMMANTDEVKNIRLLTFDGTTKILYTLDDGGSCRCVKDP